MYACPVPSICGVQQHRDSSNCRAKYQTSDSGVRSNINIGDTKNSGRDPRRFSQDANRIQKSLENDGYNTEIIRSSTGREVMSVDEDQSMKFAEVVDLQSKYSSMTPNPSGHPGYYDVRKGNDDELYINKMDHATRAKSEMSSNENFVVEDGVKLSSIQEGGYREEDYDEDINDVYDVVYEMNKEGRLDHLY